MLVTRENFKSNSFESNEKLLQNSVVLDLLSSDDVARAPAGEVNGQYRSYSMLCAAMQSDDGEIVVVRKDPYVDSRRRDDWLVAKVGYDEESGQPVFNQEHVLAASIYSNGQEGDYIELMLSQDDNQHRGPNVISFSVDKMYRPVDDQSVEFGYLNRYGERERQDGMMTKPIKSYANRIDNVNYGQDQLRRARLELVAQPIGRTALRQAIAA